jgi:hypothetical protein
MRAICRGCGRIGRVDLVLARCEWCKPEPAPQPSASEALETALADARNQSRYWVDNGLTDDPRYLRLLDRIAAMESEADAAGDHHYLMENG